jgi:hypothetical protein
MQLYLCASFSIVLAEVLYLRDGKLYSVCADLWGQWYLEKVGKIVLKENYP